MKPFSIGVVAIATSLLVLCTSFHPLQGNSSTREIIKPATSSLLGANAHRGNLFWYIDNGTEYTGYVSVETEQDDLMEEYGVLVDTNPDGGTALAIGYPIYGYPHLFFPSAELYGHFN